MILAPARAIFPTVSAERGLGLLRAYLRSDFSWRWPTMLNGVRSMIRMTDSIYIDAPVEKIYEYCADPANWPELAPVWMQGKFTNIKRTPEVKGTTFDYEGKMAGFATVKGSGEYVEAERNRRIVMHSEDPTFGSDTTTYLLEPAGAGAVLTVLDEREELAAERIPLVGRVAEWVVNQMSVQWMHVLKRKMEDKG
jgi:uncharacterized protein YndB with AHSA1/START domain